MKTKMDSLKSFKRVSLGIEGKTSERLAAIVFVQDLQRIVKSQGFSDLRNILFFVAHSKSFENKLLQRKAQRLLTTLSKSQGGIFSQV